MKKAIRTSTAAVLSVLAVIYPLASEQLEIELGGKFYSASEVETLFKPLATWSHSGKRQGPTLQYFLMASSLLNKCDSEDFRITWLWSGASPTKQPEAYDRRLLNVLERGFYYTMAHYSDGRTDTADLFDDLPRFAQQVGADSEELTVTDFRSFLTEQGLDAPLLEGRKLVFVDGRIVAVIDSHPSKPGMGIEYLHRDGGFSVEFAVMKNRGEAETMRCAFETAREVSDKLNDAGT